MMKFDSTSIYNRAVGKLQQDPNWRAITNNSVISAMLKSNAEINAETARYAEYLFRESKWDTAQNPSSVLAMANMLGYQPKRKISAKGSLYISADPRIHLVGRTISVDSFEKLREGTNEISWSANPYGSLTITPSCTIKDSNNVYYTAVSSITLDSGAYMIDLEVIQGRLKSTYVYMDTIRSTYTSSRMYPYIYIPFRITDCEDASNASSRRFFKLYLMTANSDNSVSYKEYRIVDNLLLSTSDDYDVEVYNDLYNRDLFYAKFNNDPTRGNVLDMSVNSSIAGIRVDYLESSGASGNMEKLYNTFTISDIPNGNGVKLYGINKTFITGGADEEDTASVKRNATTFYINNYSVGTKESYEKTILNTSFRIDTSGSSIIEPKKVIVYGGMYDDASTISSGVKQPCTYVSMLCDAIEDIVTSSEGTDSRKKKYEKIESALNYSLGRMKSPQDTLKFEPPTYIPLAVGLKCNVSENAQSSSLDTIESRIRDYIDGLWGPGSNYIDFGNNFIPSALSKSIMNQFDGISSVDMELEAVRKLVWGDAKRVVPTDSGQPVTNSCCRLYFDFSPVFIGNESTLGFKDFKTGSKYVFRADLIYKRPSALRGESINKTIMVADVDNRTNRSFFVKHDDYNIWGDVSSLPNDYADIQATDGLPDSSCYQVEFQDNVLTDQDFVDFKSKVASGDMTTQDFTSPGCIGSYMIYFSAAYDEDSTSIGEGWMEINFDDIYNVLKSFSMYDSNLASKLAQCPLSVLKCDTSNKEAFNVFKNTVGDYLDIYVSMRPVDSNLKLKTTSLINDVLIQNSKSVLYIDSSDSDSVDASKIENITNVKRSRMISVDCGYEDN